MPQGNLDLVRSICTSWERGDYSSVDWAHPELEWVRPDGPDPGSSTGLSGMSDAWAAMLHVWKNLRFQPEEYIELDDERVLVLSSFSGRGRMSGVEIEQFGGRRAVLFQIRDGKVTRFVTYWDRERALADLGIDE